MSEIFPADHKLPSGPFQARVDQQMTFSIKLCMFLLKQIPHGPINRFCGP